MKDLEFRASYRELKRIAEGRDALWNDWANEGPNHYDEHTRILLNESTGDLQNLLEQLIGEHELTTEQIFALGNIVYQTPGYPGATDVNVGKIDVLSPFTGALEHAEEALGAFRANLLGLGAIQVQGPITGYMPVRLERPRT